MAKLLIATAPGDGHVNPLLPIARELVGRGHDVRWYTGRAYQDRVERTGAVHEAMVDAYDYGGMPRERAFPHHAGLTGIRGMTTGFQQVFLDTAPAQLRDLERITARFPVDALISDETCFAAGFLRARRGVPLVWVATSVYILDSRDTAPIGLGLGPDSSVSGRLRNRALRWTADQLVLRRLRNAGSALRAELGLAPLPGGAFTNIVEPPDLYLMGTVPGFEYPRSDLHKAVRFVGALQDPPPAGMLPSWWDELDAGRPVLHVTQGTVANDVDRLLLPCLHALADLNALLVVTTGVPPELLDLGPLPANARVERFVPHTHLLPHTDLMVTNGGYGGVAAALAHGVPLVVAAATEEKHEVAAHVAWAGVGLHVRGRSDLAAGIRRAVDRVLREPSFRERAATLRASYREHGGAPLAVDYIEELVR
ncbi:glycosyltransferase [Pseudonocardia sp. ICBG1142]|uniref:glycosyltransferase n=1 Tax=Pseudonocardia sp. ICBG1142 TaxID=2846760 RepID=UPI001CF63A46|nr:glycosyltransferase [Pseudonocardia sp. ICBG1142]